MKSLVIVFLFAALNAHAGGGSSVGPAACAPAAVVCHTDEDKIVVCMFDKSNWALVDIESNSGSDSRSYQGVQLQPSPPGIAGSPQIYSSKEFKLSVIVDASEHPGYLSVPSMNINEQPMSCIFQNKESLP